LERGRAGGRNRSLVQPVRLMDMAECVEHRAVDENVSSDVEWDEEMRCFVLVCLDCGADLIALDS
jgi:hypothetical protein